MLKKKINDIDAMILSAGRGKRMSYNTKYKAKPLISIHNRTLLEINLMSLSLSGIKKCVINTSYKHRTILKFIKYFSNKNRYPKIISSYEKNRLETGGGVKNALKFFDGNKILVLNGDSLLTYKPNNNPIEKLCTNFNSLEMDILLLLAPKKYVVGYDGAGDFVKTSKKISSIIQRNNDKNSNSLIFTGWQIVKKELFDHIKLNNFSLNILYNRAEKENKLFGMTHIGNFLHLSTPKSYLQVEKFLSNNKIKLL